MLPVFDRLFGYLFWERDHSLHFTENIKYGYLNKLYGNLPLRGKMVTIGLFFLW